MSDSAPHPFLRTLPAPSFLPRNSAVGFGSGRGEAGERSVLEQESVGAFLHAPARLGFDIDKDRTYTLKKRGEVGSFSKLLLLRGFCLVQRTQAE